MTVKELASLFLMCLTLSLIHIRSQANENKLNVFHLDLKNYPTSSPVWPQNEVSISGIKYTGVFAEDDSKNVWYFNNNEVWSFSLLSREWTFFGKVEGIQTDWNIRFNSLLKKFYLWNKDGSIIQSWIPGDPEINMVYSSADSDIKPHHAAQIDPISGNIIVFGGREIGQDHGILSIFRLNDTSWKIITLASKNIYPSNRYYPASLFSTDNRSLHIFGGHAYEFGRQDISGSEIELSDYWVFDILSNSWSQKYLYGFTELSFYQKPRSTYFYRVPNGALNTKDKLAWYHYRGAKNELHRFMVYDLIADYGALLPLPITGLNKEPLIRHLSYDETNDEIIIFWSPWVSEFNTSIIRVSRIPVPNESVIRSLIQTVRDTEEKNNLSSFPNLRFLYSLGILLSLLLVSLAYFKIKKDRSLHRAEKEKENHKNTMVPWTIRLTDNPTILIHNIDLKDHLSTIEIQLIIWLSFKFYIGQKYQVTDRIEDMFFDKLPSLDYARKYRNKTISRINEQLSRLTKDYLNQSDWVKDRVLNEDKRKREYKLVLESVQIHLGFKQNEKGEALLLPEFTQKWAEDIRSDYVQYLAKS